MQFLVWLCHPQCTSSCYCCCQSSSWLFVHCVQTLSWVFNETVIKLQSSISFVQSDFFLAPHLLILRCEPRWMEPNWFLLSDQRQDKVNAVTSTSSSFSSETITSTIKYFTWAGIGFLLTVSTSLLNFIGRRSSLYGNMNECRRRLSKQLQTFFLPMNELQSMLTPSETMLISNLCSFLK